MLVPRDRHDEALAIAKQAAEGLVTGDPLADTDLGPVISQVQYDKIQALIASGIQDGATLVTGGRGRPEGLRGYYVKPTVFGAVTPDMRIAREEIFGPVLSPSCPMASEATMPYGLPMTRSTALPPMCSPAIWSMPAIARQMRAGQVHINSPDWDLFAPFGGYKQSGNGREYADWGMHDYLETKALIGHG
jgi:aldehyde dehydrogenase (NAD+)